MSSKETKKGQTGYYSSKLVRFGGYNNPLNLRNSQHETELEQRSFWNMLVTYVSEIDFKPSHNPIEILDVGCGKCREGTVLNSFFGQKEFGQSSPNVVITGIDIRKGVLEEAGEENRNLQFPLRLINGDATRLRDYSEIPSEIDVVVIRHHELVNDDNTWTRIFEETTNRMTPGGLGIVTSYTEHEHDLVIEKLKTLGQRILLDTRNEHAQPTRIKGVLIDKNIILFSGNM